MSELLAIRAAGQYYTKSLSSNEAEEKEESIKKKKKPI